jgi:hypothetical protein
VGDRRASPDALDLDRRWAAVREQIEAAAEVLARRGSIASRLTAAGLRVYSVRFREPGQRRQRAVYLGKDGELVRRARALIAGYRERERRVREVEAAARFTAGSAALLRRLLAARRQDPTGTGWP